MTRPTLPDTMRVIETPEFGDPEVLTPGVRELPAPEPDQVLIKVTAVGVNGPDLVQRRGNYPAPKGASDLLGLEVSGEVVATGSAESQWSVGDKVCALTNGGGYAEYVAVKQTHCLPIPERVDIVDAAGLPETFFTVWSNVFHGQTLPEPGNFLIHGGAGGIGSTAVQLGTAMGLTTFATVGTDAAADFAQTLGAHRCINFTTEDFVEILREAGGADIVLDIIGGDYVARNIKACRHDGRIVQIAFNKGSKIEINLMPIMLKRLQYTGSTLRTRSDEFKSEIARELTETVWPLFETGALRSVTHAVLPLEEAAEAHRMMEAARHHGKILLTP